MRHSVLNAALCLGLLAGCGESEVESIPLAPDNTISVQPDEVHGGELIEVTLNPRGTAGTVMGPGVIFSGGGGSEPVQLVVREGPDGPLLADLEDEVGVSEDLPKIALTAPGPYAFRIPPGSSGKAKLCAFVTRGLEEKAQNELACKQITIIS